MDLYQDTLICSQNLIAVFSTDIVGRSYISGSHSAMHWLTWELADLPECFLHCHHRNRLFRHMWITSARGVKTENQVTRFRGKSNNSNNNKTCKYKSPNELTDIRSTRQPTNEQRIGRIINKPSADSRTTLEIRSAWLADADAAANIRLTRCRRLRRHNHKV